MTEIEGMLLLFFGLGAWVFGMWAYEEDDCLVPSFHDLGWYGLLTFGTAFVATMVLAVIT